MNTITFKFYQSFTSIKSLFNVRETCKHNNPPVPTKPVFKTLHINIYIQRTLNAKHSMEEQTLKRCFPMNFRSKLRKKTKMYCMYTNYIILIFSLIDRVFTFTVLHMFGTFYNMSLTPYSFKLKLYFSDVHR